MRLNCRGSESSPPHSGHLISPSASSAPSCSSRTWSSRQRFLHSPRHWTSGSVKPSRWPEASQTLGCWMIAESSATMSSRSWSIARHHSALTLFLQQHAVVAVVVGGADPAVDLGGREDEAAPLAERDDLVEGDALAVHGWCLAAIGWQRSHTARDADLRVPLRERSQLRGDPEHVRRPRRRPARSAGRRSSASSTPSRSTSRGRASTRPTTRASRRPARRRRQGERRLRSGGDSADSGDSKGTDSKSESKRLEDDSKSGDSKAAAPRPRLVVRLARASRRGRGRARCRSAPRPRGGTRPADEEAAARARRGVDLVAACRARWSSPLPPKIAAIASWGRVKPPMSLMNALGAFQPISGPLMKL